MWVLFCFLNDLRISSLVGIRKQCNPVHYFLDGSIQASWKEFIFRENAIDIKRTFFLIEVWKMLPTFNSPEWITIEPGSKMKCEKVLGLFGWILSFVCTISSDSRAWFWVWIVWLFGAVGLSHMAVLLRIQAKLIACAGRVWQEFSQFVFWKGTHTEKWPLYKQHILPSIHTHPWIMNARVLTIAQWYKV